MRIRLVLLTIGVFALGCIGGKEDPSVDSDTEVVDSQPEDSQPEEERELYGPDNSWWHAFADEVPEDLAGTGYRQGDTAYDFTFTDQFGDQVQLYQFYGKPVQLVLFAEW